MGRNMGKMELAWQGKSRTSAAQKLYKGLDYIEIMNSETTARTRRWLAGTGRKLR
jgi:hypothetical protein